ncbi:response regulator [Marispirochaeta aestuarii]|uniref:response regulator transcription factor n=1 Tax=Marispirochaeta aestuarii TaxID=1963862 RepID=UPI0029C85E6F|nr:response regulator [Marispirochaeta aestuarii]
MRKAIVCVDDEAILLMGMKAVLEWAFGERFIYRTVCNALEVSGLLEGLQEKGIEIALLVTDLNMPDMRGDVLLEKIWEQNFRIPAIVVTGEADLYQTKLLVKKGIVKAVIKKPWKNMDFISTLRLFLEE